MQYRLFLGETESVFFPTRRLASYSTSLIRRAIRHLLWYSAGLIVVPIALPVIMVRSCANNHNILGYICSTCTIDSTRPPSPHYVRYTSTRYYTAEYRLLLGETGSAFVHSSTFNIASNGAYTSLRGLFSTAPPYGSMRCCSAAVCWYEYIFGF